MVDREDVLDQIAERRLVPLDLAFRRRSDFTLDLGQDGPCVKTETFADLFQRLAPSAAEVDSMPREDLRGRWML